MLEPPRLAGIPLRLLATVLCFCIGILLLGGVLSWYLHRQAEALAQQEIALTQYLGRILLQDEVLTMSARLAAASHDWSYEQRYRQFEPQLAENIAALKTLLPEADFIGLIDATEVANNALVGMELQSFQLAHQGQSQRAQALLHNAEYVRLKAVYVSGMNQVEQSANALRQSRERQHGWWMQGLSLGILVAAGLLLAVWMAALRAARLWEQERAQALANLKNLQKSILDSIGEGLYGIDLRGNIFLANCAAQQMLGSTALKGCCAHQLIHHSSTAGQATPEEHCQICLTLRDGAACHVEDWVFWHQNGTSFPVSCNSQAIKNEAGEIVGTMVSFRDISGRKLAEQALSCSLRELQTAYDLIVHKNTLLLESNRTRQEFLAAMSHELKTPLSAIIGFSELLKDGIAGHLSSEQRSFTQDIYDSGVKLLRLITDILEFSRFEAGHAKMETAPVIAEVWIKESVMPWRERAKAAGLGFELEIAGVLGTLWLDAVKARHIVANLLSNAVKFTPRGGQVRCIAQRVAVGNVLQGTDAEYLKIEVRDTGIGFSQRLMPRLFEPFHQDDASLARHHEGIGLGLAMVYSLVSLQDGLVYAFNDNGACVTVWLPWREHAANRKADPESLGNQHLALLIGADAQSAELSRRQLENEGLQVMVASSGAQGLQLARSEQPAMILLDLPDSEAWALLEQLKSAPRLSNIPVVVVSADPQRGLSLGAVSVIGKPCKTEPLRGALVEVQQALNSEEFDELMFLNEVRRALEKTAS